MEYFPFNFSDSSFSLFLADGFPLPMMMMMMMIAVCSCRLFYSEMADDVDGRLEVSLKGKQIFSNSLKLREITSNFLG